MRKLLCIILSIFLLFAFAACGDNNEKDDILTNDGSLEFNYDSNEMYEKIGKNYHVKYKYSYFSSGEVIEGYVVEVIKKADSLSYTMEDVTISYEKESDGYHQYMISEDGTKIQLSD